MTLKEAGVMTLLFVGVMIVMPGGCAVAQYRMEHPGATFAEGVSALISGEMQHVGVPYHRERQAEYDNCILDGKDHRYCESHAREWERNWRSRRGGI